MTLPGAVGDGTIWLPIPPQGRRWRRRLGHLPDRFARVLAEVHGGRVVTDGLRRIDDQPRRGRHDDARPVFIRGAAPIAGPVVLVDDVVTTGATLRAAMSAAEREGWMVRAAVCIADAGT